MNQPRVPRSRPRAVVARPSRPAASVRLFCFPYAGGGSSIFRSWSDHLDPSIEVCPVLLPGREERFGEPAWTVMDELVPQLAQSLAGWFDKPFAFFGHSLGGQLAFALGRYLAERGGMRPEHLFLSGCVPHRSTAMRHLMPDEAFLAEIKKMNGAPSAFLENPELIELLLPTLRSDFQLAETCPPPSGTRTSVPLTVFSGRDDPEAKIGQVNDWFRHTSGAFASHELAGDHFFLHEAAPLLEIVGRTLTADRSAKLPQDTR